MTPPPSMPRGAAKDELQTIRDLYGYNSAVRRKYLASIWHLSAKERYRDRGASYPSLVDIYMHVLDAYRWWFVVVYGRAGPIEEYPLGRRYSRQEAKRETQTVDRLVNGVLRRLTPKDLRRHVTIPVGTKDRVSVRSMLIHMAEEELQHRGEMNALLWQLDVDPPVTGFDER